MPLIERGGKWYCSITVNGRQIRKSLRTKNEKAARKLYATIEYESALGQYPALLQKPNKKVTFEDFCQEYLEWAKVRLRSWKIIPYRLATLKKHFSGKLLEQISVADVEKFVLTRKNDLNNMTGKRISNIGVNRDLLCLQAMFKVAINLGYLKENVVKKVQKLPEQPSKIDFLSKEEINRLITVCSGWLKAVILISIYCGLRRSETLSLKWGDIDFDNKLILVRMSKSGKSRVSHMPQIVVNELRELKKMSGTSEYLFINAKGRPLKSATGSFRNALARAGIRRIRFHDLRHTYGSMMAMAGADAITLKEGLGHSGLEMSLRYAHLNDRHRAEMAERLERSISTNSAQSSSPS
jgi:integrase